MIAQSQTRMNIDIGIPSDLKKLYTNEKLKNNKRPVANKGSNPIGGIVGCEFQRY